MITQIVQIVSSTELLAALRPNVCKVSPPAIFSEILEGKHPELSGLFFLPRRMQSVLGMGSDVDVPEVLLIDNRIVVYVTCSIGEPLFVEGKDLPVKFMEQFTLINNSKALGFEGLVPVPVFHIPMLGMHVVPGWEYESIVSSFPYHVLALGNHARDPQFHKECPLTVVYRDAYGAIYTDPIGIFVKSFKLAKRKQETAHLRLVYSAAP